MGFKIVGEVMSAKAAQDQTVDLSSSDLMTEIKNKTVELMATHSTISSITDHSSIATPFAEADCCAMNHRHDADT